MPTRGSVSLAACSSSRPRRRDAPDLIPGNHVHGAVKCYTRACFETIGGVQERLGWDTIDETYARCTGTARAASRSSSASTTGRWGERRWKCCAAAPGTASAPTSRTTSSCWVALRAVKRRGTQAARALGPRLLLRVRARGRGRRVERIPRPASTAGSRGASCAGAMRRRRRPHITKEHDEDRHRRTRVRRAPAAVSFAEAGCDVIGVDVDSRQGRRRCARAARTSRTSRTSGWRAVLERCTFTTRYVELHEADAILVCVPTPLTRNREPDLGPLLAAAQSLAGVIRRGQTIVLESTTFPGTTREHMVPLLEESGLRAGEDFALAFSPERVDPGRTDYTLRTTPKVVGGLTPACTEAARRRLRAGLRRDRARLDARGRRALQAAREHLPLGQHRARQRDGDARRPHGDRHLGGRRRRLDQALRLHALRARARAWAATACRSTRST